jgi:uncharacterized membrane protein YphA (DoxX/SURF4 family)
MRNPLKTDTSAGLGMLLVRLPVGIVFASLGYWNWKSGVDAFATQHIIHVPLSIPRDWAMHYLQAVPYAEMAVGAMLVVGLLARLAGFVGAAMVITLMICESHWKQDGMPFHQDFVYVGLLLAAFLVGPGKISLDGLLFKKRAPAPSGE